MKITRSGSVSTRRGPSEYFSGSVLADTIVNAPSPARVQAARVSFEPGARTAWHTHPLGQTLYVVSGVGYVQSWDGPLRLIKAGDAVWIPPDEKHWHGATPTTAMSHIAIHEAENGNYATWLEHVSDDQYAVSPEID